MRFRHDPVRHYEEHAATRQLPLGEFMATVKNPRPWPGIGLLIGECPECGSTIATPDPREP